MNRPEWMAQERRADMADEQAQLREDVRAYLRRTDTRVHDMALAAKMASPVLTAFLEGASLFPLHRERLLRRMRGSPQGYVNGHKRLTDPDTGVRLAGEELAARVASDQARRDAERRRWLQIEQQKYGLPKCGRLPEEMAA